jgi:hypothetical protein
MHSTTQRNLSLRLILNLPAKNSIVSDANWMLSVDTGVQSNCSSRPDPKRDRLTMFRC